MSFFLVFSCQFSVVSGRFATACTNWQFVLLCWLIGIIITDGGVGVGRVFWEEQWISCMFHVVFNWLWILSQYHCSQSIFLLTINMITITIKHHLLWGEKNQCMTTCKTY